MTVDRSPLAPFADRFADATMRSAGGLTIADCCGWGALNVRVDPSASAPLAEVLHFELPTQPNTVGSCDAGSVLWLGPDEWLVLSPDGPGDLETRLRSTAGTTPVSIVDVSAGVTVIAMGGSSARQVLMHGCALDLDAAQFPPGSCAQTRLALANIVLAALPDHQVDDSGASPRFTIVVRPSYSRYLATWLLDAATEYIFEPLPRSAT